MDFSGTWKVYSEENLEEFLKVIGAPELLVKMRKDVKPELVIEQNGRDFTCTIKTPFCSRVNCFTVGKESEICALDGRKVKCTVREEDGKLICETSKFTSVREIQGDEMIDVRSQHENKSEINCSYLYKVIYICMYIYFFFTKVKVKKSRPFKKCGSKTVW
uniref:Fatty acid binding protein 10b, liver basic n=1 Tax=Xiphophorus maculatus TaxID=8083 RepID=A0A3B5Q344_XIPMA